MSNNFWQGERVRLRAMASEDFKWCEDYDSENDRTTDRIYPNLTGEQMRARYERMLQQGNEGDSFRWTIVDREDNVVGRINTFDCDARTGCFKYGLGVEHEYRGKGYASEAIRLVLRYYFRELRYQKATASVYSFNTPSIRLHESLGFLREGQVRRVVYTNGQFYDELIFGMTAEEFDSIDRRPSMEELGYR